METKEKTYFQRWRKNENFSDGSAGNTTIYVEFPPLIDDSTDTTFSTA